MGINYLLQKFSRILFVSAAILIFLLPMVARADDTTSPWLQAGSPTFSDAQDITGQSLPMTVTNYGNEDCVSHKFITLPKRDLILQEEQSHVACAVRTDFGLVDPGGYLELNGTTVAGRLESAVGTSNQIVIPIPGSTTVAVLQNTANGFKLHFYENLNKSIKSVPNYLTGSVVYKMPDVPSRTLEDAAGNDLYVRPDSIGFSDNGKWMIVESEHVSTLKVNLETYEVTPFQRPYIYNFGTNPHVQTAISDDGRYALTVAAGSFRIIDTSTCSPVPTTISTYVNCSFVDHNQYVSQKVPGYKRSWQPRFINDELISFYVNADSGSGNTVAKLRMSPNGTVMDNRDYLALGDSYTAGQGTYDYYPETDTTENDCHLSPVSYPYLLGTGLSLNSYSSVACSGARIQDITTYAQKTQIPANNRLGSLLPGFQPQIKYVQENDPNIITVSVVGNDIGFGDIVARCVGYGVFPDTCYSTYEDRLELVNTINSKFESLVNLYSKIKSTAAPTSKIYAFGYPKIAQNDGDCAVNVRLDNEEIKFSNQLIEYLNSVIQKAADKSGVRYIDVADAFSGHKMCETQSYDVAVNGLSSGDKIPAAESYHPNKLGQQLHKNTILDQTANFTLGNPLPDPNVSPTNTDNSLPILDMPVSGRIVNKAEIDDSMAKDMLTVGSSATLSIDGTQSGLAPSTEFSVELHSDPIFIGTYSSDIGGNLDANVIVPSVDPGFHSLHVYGKNKAGEDVDIYKSVYVAANNTDYDGDGIPNEYDPCPIVVQSGQDQDRDGIDDACDSLIDKAPEQPPKPVYKLRLIIERLKNAIAKLKMRNIIFKLMFIIRGHKWLNHLTTY